MAENSKIEWCHHTFNPWRGCTKISPGCTHCYAETLSKRNPKALGIWGDKGTRVVASESYWRQALIWNNVRHEHDCGREAFAGICPVHGECAKDEIRRVPFDAERHSRHRVFCASLADVFEDREELAAPRHRLFDLIDQTPNLDWLLLTKRPEHISRLMPKSPEIGSNYRITGPPGALHLDVIRSNLWLGTSVEGADQVQRVDTLKATGGSRAARLFLSIEPLLGPIPTLGEYLDGIDWVIAGGESGPGARPMHPNWARSLRDQCVAAGVKFFFKQWGEYLAVPVEDDRAFAGGRAFDDPSGGRCSATMRLRSTKAFESSKTVLMKAGDVNGRGVMLDDDTFAVKVGKKAAGRLLDGREWNEFPEA